MERRAFLKALGMGLAALAARPVLDFAPVPSIDWATWNTVEIQVFKLKPLSIFINGQVNDHPDVAKEVMEFVHILKDGIRFGDKDNGMTMHVPMHLSDEHHIGFSMRKFKPANATVLRGVARRVDIDDVYTLRPVKPEPTQPLLLDDWMVTRS